MIRKRPGRKSNKPTAEELNMLYSTMTAKELAKHYGVAESTIRSWIGAYRKENKTNGN